MVLAGSTDQHRYYNYFLETVFIQTWSVQESAQKIKAKMV